MKSSRVSVSCLAASLLAVVGHVCAQTAPQAAVTLSGTSWQLVKFQSSDDKTLTPADGAKYTIVFDNNGGISVRIDCNRGHGTWKSDLPNQLQFGPLALTRASFPTRRSSDLIPKDWAYVRSYLLKNGHLFLSLMADAGTYEFEPFPAASASLENTDWRLTRLGEAAVAAASQQREPYFVLSSKSHRVSGSGGCNRFTGSYQLNGDELTFGPIVTTLMACPEGMDTEKAFLKALTETKTWKLTEQKLELFDAHGKLLASFEARPTK